MSSTEPRGRARCDDSPPAAREGANAASPGQRTVVIGGAEHGRAWVTTDPCESAEIIVARAAARITRRLDLSREQEEAIERFTGSLLDALVRGPIARINLVVEPASKRRPVRLVRSAPPRQDPRERTPEEPVPRRAIRRPQGHLSRE